MAILIEDLHDFIRGTIKKNYGGFVSPNDIDRAINRAQFDLFDQLVKNYKKTELFDYDHIFLKQTNFTLTSSDNGEKTLSSIDANFIEAITFYYKDSSNNLHEGNLMKWDSFIDRKNSSIVPPVINTATSEYKPIATIYDGKIQVAPRPSSGTYNFVLLYFKKPTNGVYGYTESNGVITQNQGTSTDLDWDERSFSDIVNRALTYLGFPIKDAEIIQAESIIDNNQVRDGNN
tara:strand:+ start:1319 stop:2014 length:696 start_codon:yes stop_codon:yes gene_type:complete